MRTHRYLANWARFARHRGGNFAIVFALAALPVAAIAGLALDYAHIANAEGKLQSAVDAAAIAGVAAAGEPVARIQALVADFVEANAGGLAADVETQVDGKRMIVTAGAYVDTPLLGVVSQPRTLVSATVTIESPVRLDGGSVATADERQDERLRAARGEMERVLANLPPRLRERWRQRFAQMLAANRTRFTR